MLHLLKYIQVKHRAVSVRKASNHVMQNLQRHILHVRIFITRRLRQILHRQETVALAKDVKCIVYNYTREPGLKRALSLVAVRSEAVEHLYEYILQEVFHRVTRAKVAGSHSA